MRKYISLFIVAIIGVMTVVSCNKLDKGTRYTNLGGGDIRIKSLSTGSPISKTYTFFYNPDGKIAKVELKETGWDETYTFDYSTPGQISIGGGKIIKLNAQGLCSEYVKNADESIKYEYNADGYMIKAVEVWQGSEEVKSNVVVVDGNITKWSKFSKQTETGDTEKVEHFKLFTYGTVANIRGIHQANNDYAPGTWQMYTGLFGKPSKNICTFYVWDYVQGNAAKTMRLETAFSADGVSPKTDTRYYGTGLDALYTFGWEMVK